MNCFQCTPEFTKMFQSFFSSSERAAYCKYQWKYDGNTQKCKVYVKQNIEITAYKSRDD
jgi:hypothetical protein